MGANDASFLVAAVDPASHAGHCGCKCCSPPCSGATAGDRGRGRRGQGRAARAWGCPRSRPGHLAGRQWGRRRARRGHLRGTGVGLQGLERWQGLHDSRRGGSHPVFVLRNSARSRGGLVVFENLIFRNGGGGSPSTSPGVTVDGGEARFVGCRFENNVGSTGAGRGGVKVRIGSHASFIGCSFSGNGSPSAGGAMMIHESNVEVLGGAFVGNRVNLPDHDPSSHGGAINVIDGTLRVSDALFQGNQAGWVGGAIFALGTWTTDPTTPHSFVSITRSTFQANVIAPQPCCPPPGDPTGGAIHVEDQTTLDVKDSRFVDNEAQFGGALDGLGALINVAGSTFQGNRGAVNAADEAIGG